nr:hypothetical protein [uncultured Rhodopila sp.]
MTDFDAVRAVMAAFAPTAGWTCKKIGWRQAVQVEHPQLGVRVCRVSEDATVQVLNAGDPPPISATASGG